MKKVPKKQDKSAPSLAGKKQPLPPQAELARLAAIVYSACRGNLPVPTKLPGPGLGAWTAQEFWEFESVRIAARLWYGAGDLCRLMEEGENWPDSERWRALGSSLKAYRAHLREVRSDPSRTLMGLESAVQWINENASAKKDRNLSSAGLEKALDAFDCHTGTERHPLYFSIEYMERFLAYRKTERSSQRSARRRTKSKNFPS